MIDGRTAPLGNAGRDISGLRIISSSTDAAIDAAELESIETAYKQHVHRARRKRGDWLTPTFICRVHLDMLGRIWKSAGEYRKSNKNIGIDPIHIPEAVINLCRDFACWCSYSTPSLEIAARLQHRLTWIHPFDDGNGRHARLLTDIYFKSVKQSLPKWPLIHLMLEGDKVRERYIKAMRAADNGDHAPLMEFISECQT